MKKAIKWVVIILTLAFLITVSKAYYRGDIGLYFNFTEKYINEKEEYEFDTFPEDSSQFSKYIVDDVFL